MPEVVALAERYGLGLPMDVSDPRSMASAVRRLRDEPGFAGSIRARAMEAGDDLSWEREEAILGELIAWVLAMGASG